MKQFDVQKVRPAVNIFCTILTMHERTGWICPYLSDWKDEVLYTNYMKALNGQPIEYHVMFSKAHNFMPAASARNSIARTVLELHPRPDWVLMIDNDMAPRPNLLDTIKDAPADAAVIVPKFSMWDESKAMIKLCWGMDDPALLTGGSLESFTIPRPGFYPLNKVGTGAIFIKPEVFEKISMPYFYYPINDDQGIEGTEDIAFAKKVIAAGLKIYGNSAVGVGHYHNCDLEIVAHAIYQAEKRAVERYTLDKLKQLGNKEQVELTGDPRLDSVATARPVVVA